MFTIVGIEVKKGQFEDKISKREISYNNFMMYVITEELPISVENLTIGCGVDTIKIKNTAENFLHVFGKDTYTVEELNKFLGKNIDVLYDKRGNVAKIIFLTQSK